MLTTIEKVRRRGRLVCQECGWNLILMEYHGECVNPHCMRVGKRNMLPNRSAPS